MRQLLKGLLSKFCREFPNVVHLEVRLHPLQRSGKVNRRVQHAVLIEDGLAIERHREVVHDIFSQGVREIFRPNNVAHLVQIEPIIRLILEFDAQHAGLSSLRH